MNELVNELRDAANFMPLGQASSRIVALLNRAADEIDRLQRYEPRRVTDEYNRANYDQRR